ncbi:uncharacterized protein LOC134540943 [Bacillus rossius redtenbacheri]|uniref:uncharacterized protein LOC134540943 n=1 Tax=Bacillus rossius redtenbacheri TaxID=93214 RepID=UPI002FDE13AE
MACRRLAPSVCDVNAPRWEGPRDVTLPAPAGELGVGIDSCQSRAGSCGEQVGACVCVCARVLSRANLAGRRRAGAVQTPRCGAAAMEASLLSGYPLLAGLLIALVARGAEAVECYVCSWSPYDHNSDVCSTGNFDPLRVQTHECDTGCEIVSMRDKNGDMEMFYRNCVTNEPVTYDAVSRATKLNEERVYTCDSRLCNGAAGHPPARLTHLLLALCAAILSLRPRFGS